MGVPALFRWLTRKYPKIVSPVLDTDDELPYSAPNPNGEVDNLYLDMNGIVHPCSHPEHKPPPETEDEMFLDIFEYTDRVLRMARPRKVLMIAVDGVAPRAKMNQQRARRFRSSMDAKIQEEERQRQIAEMESRGESIDAAVKGKKHWDSNAITPGTPFMDGLAQALRYWVAYKLSSDPGWANLQVIISDATVPGEGEHKLMNFIRSQRQDPQYDPNTKHCIYGLDADLIFLSLATHEPHFRVLREDVFANQLRQLNVLDHLLMTEEQKAELKAKDAKKPFLWLHTSVLREYLEVELFNPRLPFPFDLERAIDDWVFMCFFVGNDFLPHLPSLDVRDNGIDVLTGCWKRALPRLKDYVTCDGNLNMDSVEKVLSNLAYKEDEIFKKRFEIEKRRDENEQRRKAARTEDKVLRDQYLSTVSKGQDKAPLVADVNMPLLTTSGENVDGFAQLSNKDIVNNRATITKAGMSNAEAAAELKKLIGKEPEKSEKSEPVPENPKKRVLEEPEYGDSDPVKNWQPGYRDRYYKTKFHVETDEEVTQTRRSVVRSYLEGISWVLKYYYQGCPSWNWYYPYHYAPFAADFTDIKELVGEKGIQFNVGTPFKPFEQLMAVLPAASGIHLPEVFRKLMSHEDSEILDFYPEQFQIDMNGAKMSWQGIALLPFIDEKRLLDAINAKYHLLTENEHHRNQLKREELYISRENKNYKRFLKELYEEDQKKLYFKAGRSGLAGTIERNDDFKPTGITMFPLNEGEMPDLDNQDFFCGVYAIPLKHHGKSMLLNGFIPHEKALTQEDKNALMGGGQRYGGNRYRNPPPSDYVNKGPMGTEIYMTYQMRRGGYRAFFELMKKPTPQGYNPANQGQNYQNQTYQNQTYQNQNGYRQNYQNQNGYQNQNYGNQNGYRQNYNQNYQGQNYNQNYQNQGYNQNYQGQGNGRNNYNASRSGYVPAPNRRFN